MCGNACFLSCVLLFCSLCNNSSLLSTYAGHRSNAWYSYTFLSRIHGQQVYHLSVTWLLRIIRSVAWRRHNCSRGAFRRYVWIHGSIRYDMAYSQCFMWYSAKSGEASVASVSFFRFRTQSPKKFHSLIENVVFAFDWFSVLVRF